MPIQTGMNTHVQCVSRTIPMTSRTQLGMTNSVRKTRNSPNHSLKPRFALRGMPAILSGCHIGRKHFQIRRRLQVTLSVAKLGARVGAIYEKDRPGGISICIHRREDQRTWGLAREDARESARNH